LSPETGALESPLKFIISVPQWAWLWERAPDALFREGMHYNQVNQPYYTILPKTAAGGGED
jgi:hypothetical protein